MPKLTLLAVGKLKEKYQKEAINEYVKRLSKYFIVTIEEIQDLKISDNASKKEQENIVLKEGKIILKKIPNNTFLIVLDVYGKSYNSEEFALILDKALSKGYNNLTFVIGGSLGISKEITSKADINLSLSKMTFTHLMTREIILEQIYRAIKILHNEKYHK